MCSFFYFGTNIVFFHDKKLLKTLVNSADNYQWGQGGEGVGECNIEINDHVSGPAV